MIEIIHMRHSIMQMDMDLEDDLFSFETGPYEKMVQGLALAGYTRPEVPFITKSDEDEMEEVQGYID